MQMKHARTLQIHEVRAIKSAPCENPNHERATRLARAEGRSRVPSGACPGNGHLRRQQATATNRPLSSGQGGPELSWPNLRAPLPRCLSQPSFRKHSLGIGLDALRLPACKRLEATTMCRSWHVRARRAGKIYNISNDLFDRSSDTTWRTVQLFYFMTSFLLARRSGSVRRRHGTEARERACRGADRFPPLGARVAQPASANAPTHNFRSAQSADHPMGA